MNEGVIRHIAIIPDGNRRWAKFQGMLSFEGHRIAAEKTLPPLIEKALEMGIRYFTLWALSPQNLAREKKEVDNLFRLLSLFLRNRVSEFEKKNIRLIVIGDRTALPSHIQEEIKKAEEKTAQFDKMTVLFGINYGGREELVRAMKKTISICASDETHTISEKHVSSCLDTSGIPDPDLIIRTGGEKRLSGFMLWQSEYSELYFSNTLFPDFTPEEFEKAVADFNLRMRRFGK